MVIFISILKKSCIFCGLQICDFCLRSLSVELIKEMNGRRVRQVSVTKDGGKIGLRVGAMNCGVFVCLVVEGLAAAKAGLHFGDQILRVDGRGVAGLTVNQVHEIFRDKDDGQSFVLLVRDRPFERTVNLVRDFHGHLGFQFQDGRITKILKHSSAAQNGLLVDHNLLEINCKNVIGLKDSQIAQLIGQFHGNNLNVTIMPSFLFRRMVQEMDASLFQKMDHSSPYPFQGLLKGIATGEYLGKNGKKFK